MHVTQYSKSSSVSICTITQKSVRQVRKISILKVYGSVHRKYIPIYIQQDATLHSLFIFWNCSTCFGWYLHPSSGAHTTVSTASCICHTVTATCRYRGRVVEDSNKHIIEETVRQLGYLPERLQYVYLYWHAELYLSDIHCTGWSKNLFAPDDYSTESYKYCSKCPPPVSRLSLTRRTVFSKTVFSIARSTFRMCSVMAIFKPSVVWGL